jgi:hypothetical protein
VYHREIVGGPLFVSSGDPAELLQPADESLDAVALTISFPIEVRLALLVFLGRDDGADIAPTQRVMDLGAAVGLVAGRPVRGFSSGKSGFSRSHCASVKS